MPIQIIEKQKTIPTCPSQHKCLVPLRVTGFDRVPSNSLESLPRSIEAGDIIMAMPSEWLRLGGIFNCTKGTLVDHKLNDCIRCVRAYDIARVVLCNDDEPAPVL